MEGQFYAGAMAVIVVGAMVWYILKRKKEADARKGEGSGGGLGSSGGTHKK